MSQLLLPAAVCSLQWQRRRKLLSELSGFNFVPGFPQTIYQEFYCDASGAGSASNLNGGSDTTGPITDLAGTYKRGLGAGGTDQILASSGTPFANVVPGSYVGIKAASGTGVLDYCAAVLAVNGGGTDIFVADGTVSTRSFGTRPADAASIDSRVGGRWLGPNGAVGFPFGSITTFCTDISGGAFCVNFINTATYSITAAITHNLVGPGMFAGYSVTPRDGGRAIIDGGTAGAAYVLLTGGASSLSLILHSFQFQNNGGSANAAGVSWGLNSCQVINCIFANLRGNGASGANFFECEAYGCNQSNTANQGGMTSSSSQLIRCYSHDNTGSASNGFTNLSDTCTFIQCTSESNGLHGFHWPGGRGQGILWSCDAYGNGGSGAICGGSATPDYKFENCNFVANKLFGIDFVPGAISKVGRITNCGFGTGAFANGSGPIRLSNKTIIQSGNFFYSSPGHPYANPATGDFRLVHKQALGTGRGSFTQTGNSKSGSVAYPDVGSCQSRRPPRRVFPGGVGA